MGLTRMKYDQVLHRITHSSGVRLWWPFIKWHPPGDTWVVSQCPIFVAWELEPRFAGLVLVPCLAIASKLRAGPVWQSSAEKRKKAIPSSHVDHVADKCSYNFAIFWYILLILLFLILLLESHMMNGSEWAWCKMHEIPRKLGLIARYIGFQVDRSRFSSLFDQLWGVSNEHGIIGIVFFKGSLRWISIIKKRFLDDGGLIVINHSEHIIAANYVQHDPSLLVVQCSHDPCLELRCFFGHTLIRDAMTFPWSFPWHVPWNALVFSTKPPSTPSLKSVTFTEVWLAVSHFPWFSNTMITTM